jgi:hypothetical protein
VLTFTTHPDEISLVLSSGLMPFLPSLELALWWNCLLEKGVEEVF